MKAILLGVAAAAALGINGASAAERCFAANADGPQAGNDSPGVGHLNAILTDDESELKMFVTADYLLGSVVASHIHEGLFVVFPITGSDFSNPVVRLWSNDDPFHPLRNYLQSLYSGQLYLNIHTDLYGGGEVKGYLQEVTCAWTL